MIRSAEEYLQLAVFWEEDAEGALLCKGATAIVALLEGFNLPFVYVVRVPRLIAFVCARHARRDMRCARSRVKNLW